MNEKKEFDDILSNGEKRSVVSLDNNSNENSSSIWSKLVLACILAIIGGLTYFFIVELNPKTVLSHGVGKMMGSLETIVEPLRINYELPDKFSVTNTTSVIVDGKDYEEIKDIINNSKMSLNLMFDRTDKKMLVNLDSKISEVNFKADYYVDDKENYVFLQDIFDKYIKLDNLPIDLFEKKLTRADIEYIYKVVYNSINDNLDESFVKREFKMGSNPMVRSTLEMSQGNFVILVNNAKKDALEDEKLNQILLSYFDEDKIKEIKDRDITTEDISFENFRLVTTQSLITDNLSKVELTIDRYGNKESIVYVDNNDNTSIKFYNNEKEQFRINIVIKGKEFNLDGIESTSGKKYFTITGRSDGDYYTYTLTIPDEKDEKNNIEATLKTKFVGGSSLNYDVSLGFKMADFKYVITNNGNISGLTSDINEDVSKYIPYDEIDYDELYSKLQEKFKPLTDKINELMGVDDSYYNYYDADYDDSDVVTSLYGM